ncbi:MAG: citrate synthase/methylcitrate synthase [Anaerolineae bacterium]|nr:citrate synthase/methylcitrate synthase [Anaerolineae bacterium]
MFYDKNGFTPGLEGVVAAQTRLSSVDGQRGELIIGGYPLEELAGNATFEQSVYLLWHGSLPTQSETIEFQKKLANFRPLPNATLEILRAAAKEKADAMDVLRMAVGTLSLDLPSDKTEQAIALLARIPVAVTAYWRLCQGEEPIPPRSDGNHAANFLFMLNGKEPSLPQVRGLETYWNTVIDHGLNASTFTARVIISTGSDLVSAITGAIGALKGPLHGGAPGPALDTVFEIGSPARAEEVLRAKIARGERLMGFGHRVYKVYDPRAAVLSAAAREMYKADGDMDLYNLAEHVERTALRLLEEYKPGRNLQTNVEFYTALLLHGLDLPVALFTPTFAVSRAAGWIAHCFEQMEVGRIIRPQSEYVGEKDGNGIHSIENEAPLLKIQKGGLLIWLYNPWYLNNLRSFS